MLAADEKESHFPSAGGRPLVATTNLHDEDVFGLQLVPHEPVDDVVYVNSCATIFHSNPNPNPNPEPNPKPNPNCAPRARQCRRSWCRLPLCGQRSSLLTRLPRSVPGGAWR